MTRVFALRVEPADWLAPSSTGTSGKPASAITESSASLRPLFSSAPIAFAGMVVSQAPKKGWKVPAPLLVLLGGGLAAELGAELVTGKDPESRFSRHIYERERLLNSGLRPLGPLAVQGFDVTFGRLADGVITGIELLWDDVAIGRRVEREKIREETLAVSEAFGQKMRYRISLLLINSVDVSANAIDWPQFETKLRQLYSQQKEFIQLGYEELEYTGFLCKEAQEVKDLVASNGSISISAHEGLKRMASEEARKSLAQCYERVAEILGPQADPFDLFDPEASKKLLEALPEDQKAELEKLRRVMTGFVVFQRVISKESVPM